jgi:hypothetical protein
VGDHVRNYRFHLYADDLQIYTEDGYGYVNRLVALLNGDLQRILDWSRDNSLILNASKTQFLLVLQRIRPKDVGSDRENRSHLFYFVFALSFSEIYVCRGGMAI